MYVWGIFEVAYLSLVALIEALFVVSPLGFGGLHNDVIFCHEVILRKGIKEISTANSPCPYYSLVLICFLERLPGGSK